MVTIDKIRGRHFVTLNQGTYIVGWSDFLDSFPRFTNSAKSHLDPKSKFSRRSDARRFLARARKILTVLYTVG